jgi:cytochrome c551/c552
MKKLIGIVMIASMSVASSAAFAGGDAIFKKSGCSSCHDAEKDQLGMGLGPSLKMVSAAYKGDKDALLNFFNHGDKKIAKVAPKKFNTMKGQLRTIQKLSKDDQSALADFILSH